MPCSLLPNNPHFADYLVGLALLRKYGKNDWDNSHINETGEWTDGASSSESLEIKDDDPSVVLTPLDDRLEWDVHASLIEKMGLQEAAIAALSKDNGFKVS